MSQIFYIKSTFKKSGAKEYNPLLKKVEQKWSKSGAKEYNPLLKEEQKWRKSGEKVQQKWSKRIQSTFTLIFLYF